MIQLIDRYSIKKIVNLMGDNSYSLALKEVKTLIGTTEIPSGWLYYIKGICEDNMGHPFAAMESFKKALLLDPFNYDFLNALSTNIEIFEKILAGALDDLSTDSDEIERIHRFLEGAGELNTSILYLLARNYFIRGNLSRCEGALYLLLKCNPKNAEALALEVILEDMRPATVAS